jgi:GNAT superfamily N-acetyltransferase
MYSVNVASSDEIMKIIVLAKQYDGVFSQHIEVDVEYAQKRYLAMVASGMMTVFAMKRGGIIVGGLAGLVCPDINNGKKLAVECFWFVNEADRGKGLLLLDAYESWAKSEGCDKMALIHLEDSFPDKLKKLYERKGYKLVESHYVKEIV